ncbi:hypothetical protein U1Q18_034953 [Sarracenia purpurea var. burkii]
MEKLLLQMKINYYPKCPGRSSPSASKPTPTSTPSPSSSITWFPTSNSSTRASGVTAKCIPNSIIMHIGNTVEILGNVSC